MGTDFTFVSMPESDVYHLVEVKISLTLCGLKLSHFSSNGSQILDKKPDGGRLCRHCDDAADDIHLIGPVRVGTTR
jgi:hypothetical protein